MLAPNTPSKSRPVPVAFGMSCGWYHPGSTDRAVLLCGPVGFEALCIRQSWNVLADMLAARGFHVLRFDYPGEGDALDRKTGELLPDAAADSICAAADWLQHAAGSAALNVVALRLGAAFTLRALADRPLHRLALLAPVLNGRVFVRELRMTSQILAEIRPGQDAAEGEINVCGFLTGAPDTAAISKIKALPPTQAAHVLLALEQDRPLPDEFATAESITFHGYGRMNAPPTESVVPFDDFHAVVTWIGQEQPAEAGPGSAAPAEACLTGEDFTETHLRFGSNGQMVGVLCEPHARSDAPCVHILNAGANYHIGWAGMAVEHARKLAAEGIASFRYDFSGIGDSVWYPEGPRPHIYAARHIDDAQEAIEAMAGRGYTRHALAGLCAGGYVAFHAAGRDPRVTGAVAANAIRLVWHPDDKLDDLATEMLQPAAIYREKMLSTAEWKRLLSGEISASRVLRIIASMAQKIGKKLLLLGGVEPALSADSQMVRGVLTKAIQNGARLTFIHAERDQSRDESERHFGPKMHFAQKQPGVVLMDIPGADHELTPRPARDRFLLAMRDLVK
jgi:alpha-beta hydrolase superfamily lysophospholipase